MSKRNVLTLDQEALVHEFVTTYDLSPEQISFDGESTEPIFDYEALNVLRLRLTDIHHTTLGIVERNESLGLVTVECTATLADGRSATDLGSAQFNEVLPDGSVVGSLLNAQNVALARALRRVIRAVGYNLLKAHKQYVQSGFISPAEIDEEFKSNIGKEIHALASEYGHIIGKEKTAYQNFMQNLFGKSSTLELNDIQKSQLASIYRSMLTQRNVARLPKAA